MFGNASERSLADDDTTASITDTESSFDFELPDESQFLESSIRLTRSDMRSPQSDDTRGNSGSDTDHVLSEEEGMRQSTG